MVLLAFDVLVFICSLNESLLLRITSMSSDTVSSRGAFLKIPLFSRYKWSLGLFSGGLFLRDKAYQDENRAAIHIAHLSPPAEAAYAVHWMCLFVGTPWCHQHTSLLWNCSWVYLGGRWYTCIWQRVSGPVPTLGGYHLWRLITQRWQTQLILFAFILSGSWISTWADDLLFHDLGFFSSLTWDTLSKAFMKSKYTASIVSPLSMVLVHASSMYKSCRVVDLLSMNLYWCGLSNLLFLMCLMISSLIKDSKILHTTLVRLTGL